MSSDFTTGEVVSGAALLAGDVSLGNILAAWTAICGAGAGMVTESDPPSGELTVILAGSA
jgi:hypothetical protein